MVATAWVLGACATGVDSGNGASGPGDSGVTLEASVGQDAGGSGGRDSAAGGHDSGAVGQDAGATGDDASESDDAPSMEEAATAQDSATVQDTGTTGPESSTGQDTGTTTGGVCPGDAKYDVEAVAVIASGTFTLCLGGVCGAGQCCFEGLKPGNVCVAE